MQARFLRQSEEAGKLTWTCDVCRLPVEGDDGCVDVLDADTYTHNEGNARRPARWRVLHDACDPTTGKFSYWISVDRIDTPAKLLAWTAHLMKKPWFSHTTWDSILGTHAEALGAPHV
jgi:hypothetical protein